MLRRAEVAPAAAAGDTKEEAAALPARAEPAADERMPEQEQSEADLSLDVDRGERRLDPPRELSAAEDETERRSDGVVGERRLAGADAAEPVPDLSVEPMLRVARDPFEPRPELVDEPARIRGRPRSFVAERDRDRHFIATQAAKLSTLQKHSTCLKPAHPSKSSFQRAVTGTRTPSSASRLRAISSSV